MNRRFRAGLLLCLVIGVFAGLGVRLFYLQIVQNEKFSRRARSFYTVIEQNITPERGEILDRNGKILALNRHSYSVGINPDHVDISRALIIALSRAFEQPASEVRKDISGSGFRWLKRHISPEKAELIDDYIKRGLVVVRSNHRLYPQSPLASDIVGIVGDDNQGLSGIEYSFDSYLRSEAQKKTMIKDARGRIVYLDADNSTPVTDGTRLFLSIDSGLQYIAERELKRGFYTFKPRRAMAIIQDPHTGKILAMATYPNYDNNSKRTPSSNLLKIKPVSNIIEPGSTFKIFTAAAALNEGTVETDELFDCEGGTYTVGGFPIRDFEPHDMLTFREVIMHSSNIGMAKTAERLGRNLLYKYARDFGFGNFTGIRLPGEARGILRKPDRWSGTSLSRISFGQEVGVTGLQLVSAISAVANGGVLYEPQIIEKMKVSGDIEQFNPMPIRRVIKKETASKLNSILIDAVKKGSGEKASVRGYPVAGKTGTAQKLDFQTLTYSRDKYNAIFGGYIPADDPRLSILVIFEEPEGPFHWGGYVSAPVFSEIARASVSYLNIPPSESLMELAER